MKRKVTFIFIIKTRKKIVDVGRTKPGRGVLLWKIGALASWQVKVELSLASFEINTPKSWWIRSCHQNSRFYHHSHHSAPTNFISVCVSVCQSMWLSHFYGLYLTYYGSDFDQTWWKCWNFGLIDCIKGKQLCFARLWH